MRILLLALAVACGLPATAHAQRSPLVRITGTADQYMSASYDKLGLGYTFGSDVLFGVSSRVGIGVRYAESAIADEAESMVTGGIDLVFATSSPGGFYVEGRAGYEAQGFDVVDTRYVYQGFHLGAAAGFLQAMGPVWADVAIEGGYFSSFAAWANDNELDDALSGARLGLRLGIALAGGGN